MAAIRTESPRLGLSFDILHDGSEPELTSAVLAARPTHLCPTLPTSIRPAGQIPLRELSQMSRPFAEVVEVPTCGGQYRRRVRKLSPCSVAPTKPMAMASLASQPTFQLVIYLDLPRRA